MANLKKAIITLLLFLLILTATTVVFGVDSGKATQNAKLKKTIEESSITLEIIPKGDEFEILEEEGNWYRVNYKKIKGYVKKELVEITNRENSDDNEKNTKGQSQETKENNENSNQQTKENNKNSNEQSQETKEGNNTNTAGNTPNEEPVTNTVDNQTTTQVSAPVTDIQTEIKEGSKVFITSEVTLSLRPLVNSMKIGTVKQNEQGTVINIANGWVYLSINGKTGWLRKEKLAVQKQEETVPTSVPVEETPKDEETTKPETTKEPEQNDTPQETVQENKTAYVSSDGLNIRKEASTESEIVDVLGKNAKVTIVKEEGTWCKITYKNTEGYAPKKYLSDEKVEVTSRSSEARNAEVTNIQEVPVEETKKETTTSKTSELVKYAKQYLGSRYVYGGTTPSGFDCSGFVMYVYKQFGVSLPHSSSAQSKKGTKVEKANLQQGDIVFFSDYKTHKGIGHCGIYIGNNQFIHASTEKTGVITSSLNSGSYKTRYVTAVRIF